MGKSKTAPVAGADKYRGDDSNSVLAAYKSIEMSENATAAILRWMIGRA